MNKELEISDFKKSLVGAVKRKSFQAFEVAIYQIAKNKADLKECDEFLDELKVILLEGRQIDFGKSESLEATKKLIDYVFLDDEINSKKAFCEFLKKVDFDEMIAESGKTGDLINFISLSLKYLGKEETHSKIKEELESDDFSFLSDFNEDIVEFFHKITNELEQKQEVSTETFKSLDGFLSAISIIESLGRCRDDIFCEFEYYLYENKINFRKTIENYFPKEFDENDNYKISWIKVGQKVGLIDQGKNEFEMLKDTMQEMFKYISEYVVAMDFIKNGTEQNLNKLSKEDTTILQQKIIDDLVKYFFENNTINRIANTTKAWHKFRNEITSTSQDGSTIRDFYQEGKWYEILPEKTLTVPKFITEDNYTVVNADCSEDLGIDGKVLKHCVVSYIDSCEDGYSHIFSIRKNGIPTSTIEYNMSRGSLYLNQHKGYKNEEPDAVDLKIREWLEEKYIDVGNLRTDKIGARPFKKKYSEFENMIGVSVENLTSERLDSNMKILLNLSIGNGYIFGKENKEVTLEQFLKNMEKHIGKNLGYFISDFEPKPELKEAMGAALPVGKANFHHGFGA